MTFFAPPSGVGVGSGAGRRVAGRCGGVVELFVFCAEAATASDNASAAAMNNFLNMMTPLVKLIEGAKIKSASELYFAPYVSTLRLCENGFSRKDAKLKPKARRVEWLLVVIIARCLRIGFPRWELNV
jgi:hypothetical protein